MSATATQICQQFEKLSNDERIEVLHMLWQSFPNDWEEGDAGLALAESRDTELSAGTKRLVSENEFQQQMKSFKAAL